MQKEENKRDAEMKSVARVALGCITEYFNNPENRKAFEEWKAKQNTA